MHAASQLLTAFVALQHVVVPRARDVPLHDADRPEDLPAEGGLRGHAAPSQNQGLYNGFLAAGLLWALSRRPSGAAAKTFFLGCVIVAGVFGALTVSRRILTCRPSRRDRAGAELARGARAARPRPAAPLARRGWLRATSRRAASPRARAAPRAPSARRRLGVHTTCSLPPSSAGRILRRLRRPRGPAKACTHFHVTPSASCTSRSVIPSSSGMAPRAGPRGDARSPLSCAGAARGAAAVACAQGSWGRRAGRVPSRPCPVRRGRRPAPRLYLLHHVSPRGKCGSAAGGVERRGRKPGEGRRASLRLRPRRLRVAPSTGALAPGRHREAGQRAESSYGQAWAEAPAPRLPAPSVRGGDAERVSSATSEWTSRRREHVVAAVDAAGEVLLKATAFRRGRRRVPEAAGPAGRAARTCWSSWRPRGTTGKTSSPPWRARGFAVALINPLRTRRFAEEDLQRTKTDAIDALGIAQFAAAEAPRRPRACRRAPPRSCASWCAPRQTRAGLGRQARQLHRLVDLGFPGIHPPRAPPRLGAGHGASLGLPDGRRRLPAPVPAPSRTSSTTGGTSSASSSPSPHRGGRRSVGAHHAHAYRLQVKHACEDLDVLRAPHPRAGARHLEARSTRTKSARCSPPSTAWARRRPPSSWPNWATPPASTAPPSPPTWAWCPACASPASAPAARAGRPIGHAGAARGAVDARPHGRAAQPLAQGPLRAAARPRQAAQGGPRRLHAQAAARHLLRRQAPPALHPPAAHRDTRRAAGGAA